MHWNRAPSRTAVLILAIGVLACPSAWGDEVPIDDAIDREFSVFNNNMGQVGIDDAVSREYSVHNQMGAIAILDATSREFTVFNQTGAVPIIDAVSREFTVFNDPNALVAITDAISREFTVFNDPNAAVAITDAISREFTVYNHESSIPTIDDASSREWAIWNLNPAGAGETAQAPQRLTLLPARPNPFTHKTTVQFGLPRATSVTVSLYEITGRRVLTVMEDVPQAAGWHTVEIDGSRLANGFYFYRVMAGREVKKGTVVIRR